MKALLALARVSLLLAPSLLRAAERYITVASTIAKSRIGGEQLFFLNADHPGA